MQGLSFKQLSQCASRNAVVMLIATEAECHALILSSENQEPVTLKLSDITPNELAALSIVAVAAQRRGAAPDDTHDNCRGMKASPYNRILCQTRSDAVLETLWTTVVKPIIDHLRIQVCTIHVILRIILM
jgi:hypothetical protein